MSSSKHGQVFWHLSIERLEAMGNAFEIAAYQGPGARIAGIAPCNFFDVLHVEVKHAPPAMHPVLAARVLAAAFLWLEDLRPEQSDYYERTVEARSWLESELGKRYAREVVEIMAVGMSESCPETEVSGNNGQDH